jgi:hypothetical protein
MMARQMELRKDGQENRQTGWLIDRKTAIDRLAGRVADEHMNRRADGPMER